MKLRRLEVAACASVAAAVGMIAFPVSLALAVFGVVSLWPAGVISAVLIVSGATLEWANAR